MNMYLKLPYYTDMSSNAVNRKDFWLLQLRNSITSDIEPTITTVTIINTLIT